MITRIKEAKSLSSSSAFIIIIVLIVVSVAAIVVGGGDGFSRKYAGVDLREFSGKMLLAQTGVVGKILKFHQEDGDYTLDLLPIELDSALLSGEQKYVTSVVPPREGDTPFSYRPEEGVRVTQGYPILREYAEQNSLASFSVQENNGLPSIPGMKTCNTGADTGKFYVFYEDVAYDTNIGFDDPELGTLRQNEVCGAMHEFEDILLLDNLGLQPGIVVQASTEKTPNNTLSVVSPQYVGGSGFVSTLLADYLRSGLKRSDTSFSDTVSVLGVNSGFMRFSFAEDVAWSVDTGNESDYDLATVTKQNMLRLLGFGSFLGHEQENILSSSWERWTEWDRLLTDSSGMPLINDLSFTLVDYTNNQTDFEPGDSDNYDVRLTSSEGAGIVGAVISDYESIPSAQSFDLIPIFTSQKFQKGQSLSGLADPTALSYPILGRGEVKNVSQAEKEILCMLGLGVNGVGGCNGPRAVAQDVYIERQNNKTVCVNIAQGLHSSASKNFLVDGQIVEKTGNVDMSNPNQFKMYKAPCPSPYFENSEDELAFAHSNQTTSSSKAVSFSWTPSQSESLYREYVQFAFSVKDTKTQRKTDERTVSIHKCVVTATGNQLCNGDFQFSGATSSIDYKLPSLELVSGDNGNVVTCQNSTLPGWCAQGVQDGFSSEFGYTWHPYLIQNPEAFDAENDESPRVYAGGSSGAIVQRLRVPLEQNTSYLVTGKVYVTRNGLRPTFWYGPQDSVLKQSDGTYHVDYPEALIENEGSVINEYVLTDPLTTGEWHSFSWTLNTGTKDITHIAFGGSNNNGFILYDDLSVQAISSCGDCLTDINGDCVTSTDDLTAFLDAYAGDCPGDTVGCTGDINFDGTVNADDLLQFISQYGSACLVGDPKPVDTEICTDGIDNDGDGNVDSNDSDCALDQNCEMAGTCEQGLLCSDRKDNDGDGLIDSKDPDCVDTKNLEDTKAEMSRTTAPEDAVVPIVVLDEDGIVEDVTIETRLLEQEEVVPNASGFTANYLVVLENNGGSLEEVNLVGVLPSTFVYNEHVATEPSVAYERTSNTIVIPEIGRGDTVQLYFNVDLTPNICAQIESEVETSTYSKLVDLDLCSTLQEIVEKKYGIVRDPETGIITKLGVATSGGNNRGSIYCSDGIDNDGDGLVDKNDPECVTTKGVSETDQCFDSVDNDGDGLIDVEDRQCIETKGLYESEGVVSKSECKDGIDNDGDKLIDGYDDGCDATKGASESLSAQCDDGIDNDKDGLVDMSDRECSDPSDTNEEK